MSAVAPVLEVTGLTKRYGDFTAVDEVSFLVRPGETLGVLGPNGAGKTTTIHMILGLVPSTAGSVLILGRDPHHDRGALEHVASFFVPASHVFEGMRGIILEGSGFPGRELALALAIDALYVLGAGWLFSWSLRQVRARGLLSRFGE